MPNRLATESSPYLLQHAANPVDWYPWGPDALERARTEHRPILLSIGYAACHWCHVMAHESFEDPDTAALMNERFVNIKVDREERPDLDTIYMQAVQAMTGHGGWPMTVFLTPDGVPFYGGTYFPKHDRPGMPSFRRILESVSTAFASRPDDVARTASAVREMYDASVRPTRSAGPLSPALLDRAYHALSDRHDEAHGGFEDAPKFPHAMALEFLLTYWARTGAEHALAMVRRSFAKMAGGGIYDQVGGGFARYAVDAAWRVPHFEKMLYDNALLVKLGVLLWQATHEADARRVVDETIAWAVREMRLPGLGFASSLDADSEGGEGAFYVWTAAEFDALLGDDAPLARAVWGVTGEGNFEGATVLSAAANRRTVAAQFAISEAAVDETVARARATLAEARARRPRPGRDDKVLASWNALMVRAIAGAARAFGDPDYRAVAVETGTLLFESMVRDGRALRSLPFAGGQKRIAGYLEDHAALGLAALALYELTFDERWLERARQMSDATVRWFWDDDIGAFHDTASDQDALITRPRDVTDNATPSGTSLAVELLARLGDLLGDDDATRRATHVAETLAPAVERYPLAFGHLLGTADLLVNGAVEVAIAGDVSSAEFGALDRAVADRYVPSLVLAGGPPRDSGGIALLTGRAPRDGHATAYVCRNHACDEPALTPDQLGQQLEAIVAR